MRDRLRLGLRLNNECGPLKRAIARAAQLGFSAIELSIDHPEVGSANLSESGRRHLARLIRNSGMNLVSISAPTWSNRCDLAGELDRVIACVAESLRMSRDMSAPLATVESL